MPPVTLYTKEAEQEIWDQARAAAEQAQQSLSAFVADALRAHLARRGGSRPDESSLALARRLVNQLERAEGHTKTARKRVGARRRA